MRVLYAAIVQPVQPDNPAFFFLVPVEPTVEMISAMAVEPATVRDDQSATVGMAGAELAYAAMLAAAGYSIGLTVPPKELK